MSSDGTNLYDEDGALRYAPVPKASVKRSQALISRMLSFLLRAPHARARGQAMKGLLYIIPADPKAIRERCALRNHRR